MSVRPHSLLARLPFSSKASDIFDFDHVVVGAGVVGLAIAERLSSIPNTSTLVLERHGSFGVETSSRNSEVLHAGIYYPRESLKTKLCIRGNQLLTSLCVANPSIALKKCGKWIVATTDEQNEILDRMQAHARDVGVDVSRLSVREAERIEPMVKARGVLVSPGTGVFDSHALMAYLEGQILNRSQVVAYQTTVTNLTPLSYGCLVTTTDRLSSTPTSLRARTVINAAGLGSERIAAMLLPPSRVAHVHPCKGHYFGLRGRPPVSRLVYPVPEPNLKGLGIHCTIDLAGNVKFGPDAEYVDSDSDYGFGARDGGGEGGKLLDAFHRVIVRYMPVVRKEDLFADYTGIRPKLSGPGEPVRDFVIETPVDFPFFLNLTGIESPGLTASLAIAEKCTEMLGYPSL
ncbi:FAD dependent oxidoreductase [Blyttiomyces helicus]|uniref:L-2-hydroxyglutarate dehydrogenase, mitochondrial n=1 Tax=Blyttiomyces helicus TaxID=388810 RepID=A0A4P9WA27_9FUNG|nr:FAD dependent oxidoreductase [Blyttiomyces helicus]|eukprot:RKO87086.1 FAD dependent oxidoreductase [Blyttiomyces helicus]